jgi:N-acetylglucosaminyldiphosphoundecaprenol N-acetyl-beta-D-mannosaminyltransferase
MTPPSSIDESRSPVPGRSAPGRSNVLGVGISAINLPQATAEIERWILDGERKYVNVCTVHTVMECQNDVRLRAIVNGSGLSTPDGMPLVWLNRLHGHRDAGRVYGPDLMLALCERGQDAGYRHYFYGGAAGVADRLVERLRERFPRLQVAGTHSPPFRTAGAGERADVLAGINDSRPDIVWVGLGTPKQDYWMANHRSALSAPALVAVGAAFDFHAGLVKQAPPWMQRSGLEWLFRLLQEPRRLAYRYIVFNPLFVWRVAMQLTGLRRYPLPGPR